MDKYGFWTPYDAGCAIGPKLSTIILDGEWYWPSARSDKLVEIQSRLPEVVLANEDLPVWKSSKGIYIQLCRNVGAFKGKIPCCGMA
jgi:hypothetical protein